MIENRMVTPFADDDAGDDLFCHAHSMAYSSTEGCYACAEERAFERIRQQEIDDDSLINALADIARTQV